MWWPKTDFDRRVQAELYARRELSGHPAFDQCEVEAAGLPGSMCVDVVGEIRRDKEVTPVGLRESDCVAKAREGAIAEPNRGKAQALEPRRSRIADQGKVL